MIRCHKHHFFASSGPSRIRCTDLEDQLKEVNERPGCAAVGAGVGLKLERLELVDNLGVLCVKAGSCKDLLKDVA